jgi:adenine-specific DNA-methyltransferase
MATSIPRSRRDVHEKVGIASLLPEGLQLTYEGKACRDDIVGSTSSSPSIALWPQAKSYDASDNRLYLGDNLDVLAQLFRDTSIRGNVNLIYIDPPFATGGVFHSRVQRAAYEDIVTGTQFIEFLRKRLILLHELLAEDGSIYVHLDKNMAFPMKIIMDEVFGAQNFRSWITRQKSNPKNYTSKTYGNISDFILFYTKSEVYTWHRPVKRWLDVNEAKEYRYQDEDGRRYMKVPVHAPGVRNGATGKPWRDKLPPPGKHWQYTPDQLDRLDATGKIYWSASGNPRRKVYFDEHCGVPVQDIWLDFRDAHNQNIKITGFPTEKNPELLKHIISASSNVGDLVLDCFSGSGTTLASASELGRRWIGVDKSPEAIATTLKRFCHGTSPMGDFVERTQLGVPHAQVLPGIDTAAHVPITDFTFYAVGESSDYSNETLAPISESLEKLTAAQKADQCQLSG